MTEADVPSRLGVLLAIALVVSAGLAIARSNGDEVTLDPGTHEEFNFRMDAGWSIDYNWSADAPVDFNIHSHVGARADYHVENGSTNGSAGRFEAPERRTYSLLWDNRGDGPAEVTWSIDGQWIARSEHFDDEEATPGPGSVAALVALLVASGAVARYRSW